MSERGEVPISEVLGDGRSVKVEESWSKFVPAGGAEGAGVPEFNRTAAILEAVKRRREGTHIVTEEMVRASQGDGQKVEGGRPLVSHEQYFFVCKGRKMEYIGSREVDLVKFQRDISGRFFREWVKKQFDGRRDCDDIVSFGGEAKLKEIVDLMEMV